MVPIILESGKQDKDSTLLIKYFVFLIFIDMTTTPSISCSRLVLVALRSSCSRLDQSFDGEDSPPDADCA
jgi:hypothetical protein